MHITGPTPRRREEIRRLLRLTPAEVVAAAGDRLVVFADIEAIHARIAEDIAGLIRRRNARNEATRLILPVGPVGQYPILLESIRRERLSLRNGHFFFMDEYADESGRAIPPSHPLSFAGRMRRLWLTELEPDLAIPPEQIHFPSEKNIELLEPMIAAAGGIDACFGGIGIHGHLAFNEPEEGVRDSGCRLVRLNDYTVTINAVRARVGGNLESFPRQAYTLGMRQLMAARALRLVCRNGIGLDWANTVLRLTLLGEPGDDYPCTWAHTHPDFVLYTDRDTLQSPEIIL
jgi:glucosamine-6-phosphate deaminase